MICESYKHLVENYLLQSPKTPYFRCRFTAGFLLRLTYVAFLYSCRNFSSGLPVVWGSVSAQIQPLRSRFIHLRQAFKLVV
jgi:hypothetical protein